MRLAVIGSGKIVQELLGIVDSVPGLDVVAIQGREASRDTLDALAARHAIPQVYTALEDCLTDPDVDTVYVGLPNDLHCEVARAALEAGKHVVCEKPVVPSVAQLDQLIALAEARGLVLVEAITTVHLASFRAMIERLPALGRIRLVESVYTQRSSRYDAFRAGDMPPAFDPARGGGALMDVGVYTLHAILAILGEPASVSYLPNLERGADTSGIATLTYPHAIGVGLFAKDADGPSRTVVHGDEGWIEMRGAANTGGEVHVHLRGEVPTVIDVPDAPHRMIEEFREFIRIIGEGDMAERDRLLAHSRGVLSVLEAARGSSDSG